MSMGNFPDSLSQAILVGIILVGRLGVWPQPLSRAQVKIMSPGIQPLRSSHVQHILKLIARNNTSIMSY